MDETCAKIIIHVIWQTENEKKVCFVEEEIKYGAIFLCLYLCLYFYVYNNRKEKNLKTILAGLI